MRIAFAIVCLTVIGAVAGVGVRAIGGARDMTVKQQQELDSAINQIVFDHKEQKEKERQEAALATAGAAAAAARAESEKAAKIAAATEGKKGPETAERSGRKAPERAEPKVAAQKSQRSRQGRSVARANGLIPHAFVSLPKFAASTATSLFGLR